MQICRGSAFEDVVTATADKCQICGEVKPLTRDHIPQQALYPKAVRSSVPNLNIVMACFECNNAGKVVDELMKAQER
jgi:5-methylcytosine-specific restriction endonuclease McrA